MTSSNLFLDGVTFGKCRDKLQELKERGLVLTERSVHSQRHVFKAHISLYTNVEKSKLTHGTTTAITRAINAIIQNGGDFMLHWMHQTDEEGRDIFSVQYTSDAFSTPTWVFYADGQLWYQFRLQFWISHVGSLLTFFSCGEGKNAAGITKQYNPTPESWTKDRNSADYRTAVRCMWKYFFNLLNCIQTIIL